MQGSFNDKHQETAMREPGNLCELFAQIQEGSVVTLNMIFIGMIVVGCWSSSGGEGP